MKNKKFIFVILLIGIVAFLISKFIFSICIIHGNSMIPTLKDKDLVIESKLIDKITNGDVVVIRKNNLKMIKRIIGIPGDTVEIKDNYVFVNGIKYDSFITTFAGNLSEKVELCFNEYIVLGDNREESIDSRYSEIGIIKRNEIVGKIV